MAWGPSLAACYGPAAFIALVTCVYFLGTYVQLRRHPERRYELRERPEEQQRLAGLEAGHSPRAARGEPPASLLQNEHPLKAQLRAAACTLFLFAATWAFGDLEAVVFLGVVTQCLWPALHVILSSPGSHRPP